MLKLSPHPVDYHGPITTQSIAPHRKESREVNEHKRANEAIKDGIHGLLMHPQMRERKKKRRAREKTETKTKSVICRCIEELFVDVCCSSRWYEEAKRAKFKLCFFFSLFDCTYVRTQCWAFVLFCCALLIHVSISCQRSVLPANFHNSVYECFFSSAHCGRVFFFCQWKRRKNTFLEFHVYKMCCLSDSLFNYQTHVEH